MERRLIDANALIENGHKIQIVVNETDSPFDVIENQGKKFLDLINQAPTVDAVEVVRCMDCVLWRRVDKIHGKCPFLIGEHQYTGPDHYCSCGERRAEDAVD